MVLETYWGLRESPFRSLNERKYFFASPTHTEALARLQFLLQQQRSLGVLSGAEGMGKSLLLKVFAHELRQSGAAACSANLLGMEPTDFAWSLAADLGTNPRTADSSFVLWRRIADRLHENRCQGQTTVLLLDDADQALHDVLIHVLRLLKSHPGAVTIILAVDESRLSRLGGDLLQLAELRIRLEPWDQHDVGAYLRTTLERAGRTQNPFEDTAVVRLQELSNGIPRWVAQCAELSLASGAAQRLETIPADIVEAVHQELGLPEWKYEGLST